MAYLSGSDSGLLARLQSKCWPMVQLFEGLARSEGSIYMPIGKNQGFLVIHYSWGLRKAFAMTDFRVKSNYCDCVLELDL